jgi:hypothetical protein
VVATGRSDQPNQINNVRAADGQDAADAPVPRTLGTEVAGMADGRRVVARGHGIGTARDGLWASAAVVPRTALEAKFGGQGRALGNGG